MAATFNWTISTLERELSDGGVIIAHWRCSAEETVGDDTFTASNYSTVSFIPDPTAPDFIPYDNLTEADVLGWVYEVVDKAATESSLQTSIDEQKNPTTADGVPW